MSDYSESAKAYVEVERRTKDVATWMDVAAAYDAGMRHGLEARRNAMRQLGGGPKCAVCGFAAGMAIHVSTHLYGKPSPGGLEYHAYTPETA